MCRNESITIESRVVVSNCGDARRTRLARRAIVDAARSLFLVRGYGATTIKAISAVSDVPPAAAGPGAPGGHPRRPPLAAPDPATFGELTPAERAALADLERSGREESGYSEQQATRPQTLD